MNGFHALWRFECSTKSALVQFDENSAHVHRPRRGIISQQFFCWFLGATWSTGEMCDVWGRLLSTWTLRTPWLWQHLELALRALGVEWRPFQHRLLSDSWSYHASVQNNGGWWLMIIGDYTAIQHTSGDYHLVYVNGFLEPFFSGIISSQALLAKESAANKMRQPIRPTQSESPENCEMQLWAAQCDSHRSWPRAHQFVPLQFVPKTVWECFRCASTLPERASENWRNIHGLETHEGWSGQAGVSQLREPWRWRFFSFLPTMWFHRLVHGWCRYRPDWCQDWLLHWPSIPAAEIVRFWGLLPPVGIGDSFSGSSTFEMTLRRYVIHSLLKVLYQSGWNLWRKSPKFVWLLCFAGLLVTTYLCSAFV